MPLEPHEDRALASEGEGRNRQPSIKSRFNRNRIPTYSRVPHPTRFSLGGRSVPDLALTGVHTPSQPRIDSV